MTNEKTTDSAAYALSAGLERTQLSSGEHTALIRASRRDSVLQCAFGPGWVALLPVPENKWAFDLLADMRSNALGEGRERGILREASSGEAATSTDGLERMDDLTAYAEGLLKRLRMALEAEPRHSPDARIVALTDLCGAIQLIQAGAENLRDVERLNWYASRHPAGTLVHQAIQHEIAGSGIGARAAIDDAMMRSNAK